MTEKMTCRPGCGACCIAPSISSAIPGMPEGKPAGVRCVQLSHDNRCLIFASSLRPEVCEKFSANVEICADNKYKALYLLSKLELETL